MDLLWNLFFSLQIVCYFVIYDVPMPANVGIYVEEFTKLVEFRMISINNIVATITGDSDFNFMQNLTGNEKDSILSDLSVYLVMAAIAIVVILIVSMAYFIRKYRRLVKKLLHRWANRFFFNGLIRYITIAYIKICISSGQ